MSAKSDEGLKSVDFEIFGQVQGVSFRAYTKKKGKSLGLKGWCMNTREGTVKGKMEGDVKSIREMKDWLLYKGSPQSRIDKAEFSNEKDIEDFTCDSFTVTHD